MKTAKRRRPGQARDKPGTKGTTRRRVVLGMVAENLPNRASYAVSRQLQDLLKNEDLPASARVTAARTLAEIEGLIGRHQPAPVQGTTAPLSSLSRDELIGELERLRTAIDLGIVR